MNVLDRIRGKGKSQAGSGRHQAGATHARERGDDLVAAVTALSPESETDQATRAAAWRTVTSTAAVGDLREIISTGTGAARSGAVMALTRMTDRHEAADTLLALISAPDETLDFRDEVAFALSKIGDPRAARPITEMLVGRLRELSREGYANTPEVLDIVVERGVTVTVAALIPLRPHALTALDESLQAESDPFVRKGIERVLARLTAHD
jgi:HEAT repeat protein